MLGLNYIPLIGAGIIGIMLGFGSGNLYGDNAGYKRGNADALFAVEKSNAAAKQTVDEARTRLNDCYDSGGVWNQSAGKCIR